MAQIPQTPTTLDTSNEHTTTALYRAAIGPVNTEYYLSRFSQFEGKGRAGAQWNWAAALNTINWMVFRKLWIPALAYTGCVLGVLLVVFGIGGLVFQFSSTSRWILAMVFLAASVLMPGFYGTALFHNACRKKMEYALIHTATLTEACTLLNRQASQRPRILGIALVNFALLGILIGIIAGLRRNSSEALENTPPSGNIAVGRAIEDTAVTTLPEPIVNSAPVANEPAPPPVDTTAPVQPAAANLEAVPTLPPLPALPAAPVPPPATATSPAETRPPATSTNVPTPPPVAKTPKAVPATPPAVTPIKPGTPLSAAKNATNTKTPAPVKEPEFIINVGLFADENNARNARTLLQDAGLNAYSEELNYPRGKRTRVRVGPFATDTEADTAAEKIRNLGLEAAVLKQ
jgi:cell division protein FtsN